MFVVKLIEEKNIKSIIPLLSELNPNIEQHILEAEKLGFSTIFVSLF